MSPLDGRYQPPTQSTGIGWIEPTSRRLYAELRSHWLADAVSTEGNGRRFYFKQTIWEILWRRLDRQGFRFQYPKQTES